MDLSTEPSSDILELGVKHCFSWCVVHGRSHQRAAEHGICDREVDNETRHINERRNEGRGGGARVSTRVARRWVAGGASVLADYLMGCGRCRVPARRRSELVDSLPTPPTVLKQSPDRGNITWRA
jgi:hypothetical protein